MEIEYAIEILKEFKKTGYHTLRIKYNKDRIEANSMIERAIETLLTAYEKEKEKNKKFIAVDKIKAKIEEYEDFGTSIYYGLRSNGKVFHQAVRMEVKQVLQSLLEKE